MKCSNRNCDKNPEHDPNHQCINIDGDFVCNDYCKKEYENQRDRFFNEIVNSEKITEKWLLGEIE